MRTFVSLALLLLLSAPAFAQGPDYDYTPAQRDSVLAEYDNIFPIWGRKAVERGFELPLPAGLNLNYLFMNQDITISNLGLSLGNDPTQDVDFIELSPAKSTVQTMNFRADLWVLPFLNVYGIAGSALADTEVGVLEPVQFTSKVDQTGVFGGVGITGTMGIKRNFAVVDVNWSWSNFDKLVDTVEGRVLSLRFGRQFDLSGQKAFALWVGTMNQKFGTITEGSVNLSDVVPPDFEPGDYQNSDWYMNLGPGGQALVDRIMNEIISGDPSGTTINYRLDKEPAQKWNMLAGANYQFTRSWQLRAEFGFIERYSVFLNLNYRFNL